MNCWYQHGDSTNPAHWAMAVSPLCQMGQRALAAAAATARHDNSSSSSALLPTFQNLVLHQCASLKDTIPNWSWGRALWEVATSRWMDSGLWHGIDRINFIEHSIASGNGTTTGTTEGEDWVCFEDLYMSPSYGHFGPAIKDSDIWREGLLKAAGVEDPTILDQSQRDPVIPDPNQGHPVIPDQRQADEKSLEHRCREGKLRIQIFQRTPHSRAFANLAEVMTLAQEYTREPVKVVTVGPSTPLSEQASVFSNYDLMISPHGSQLVNMVFSDAKHSAIIEVVPANWEDVFKMNAQRAGFAHYHISTSHDPTGDTALVPSHWNCSQGIAYMERNCPVDKDGVRVCRNPRRNPLIYCDIGVHLDILREDIRAAIKALC